MDSNLVTMLFYFLVGVLFGNLEGDQATLRDCATKSEAKMVGGGVVKCEVKREDV